MEPITKVSHIPASRWALSCSLCREHTGTCIQVYYQCFARACALPVYLIVFKCSKNPTKNKRNTSSIQNVHRFLQCSRLWLSVFASLVAKSQLPVCKQVKPRCDFNSNKFPLFKLSCSLHACCTSARGGLWICEGFHYV